VLVDAADAQCTKEVPCRLQTALRPLAEALVSVEVITTRVFMPMSYLRR
jgi:hypothetical protein